MIREKIYSVIVQTVRSGKKDTLGKRPNIFKVELFTDSHKFILQSFDKTKFTKSELDLIKSVDKESSLERFEDFDECAVASLVIQGKVVNHFYIVEGTVLAKKQEQPKFVSEFVFNPPEQHSALDELDSLVDDVKKSFEKQPDKKVKISKNLTKQQKIDNVKSLILSIKNKKFEKLSSIFKDKEHLKVNVDNYNGITFQVEFAKNSELDKQSQSIVKSRNKKMIQIDSVDGELAFAVIINEIFDYCGLDSTVDVDDKHYSGVGDAGDLRVGNKRIDVKTRQRKSGGYCNLLINEETLSKGFNNFVYTLREGDFSKTGNHRWVYINGYVSLEDAKNGRIEEIKYPSGNGSHFVREFRPDEVFPLNALICDILLDTLKKEIV